MTPEVSVILLTHDRPERLRRALAALRAQTLERDRYEIVLVDDASGPETVALIATERALPGPALRLVRRAEAGGVAWARNSGIEVALAPLLAFTDDDCEVSPRWLAAGLAAWRAGPKRFVQGMTLPNPAEAHLLDQFAHTLRVERLGPYFENANVFYPREALDAVGGMDVESFGRWGGEDVDLAKRVIAAGYEPVWAPDALVHHAVERLTPRQMLRKAWRWDGSMLLLRRYPELREHMALRLFWNRNHWWLVRALIALALPSRVWWLRWWLAAPYVLRLGTLRPDKVAVLVASDCVEIAACARGGVRYRVPVL